MNRATSSVSILKSRIIESPCPPSSKITHNRSKTAQSGRIRTYMPQTSWVLLSSTSRESLIATQHQMGRTKTRSNCKRQNNNAVASYLQPVSKRCNLWNSLQLKKSMTATFQCIIIRGNKLLPTLAFWWRISMRSARIKSTYQSKSNVIE